MPSMTLTRCVHACARAWRSVKRFTRQAFATLRRSVTSVAVDELWNSATQLPGMVFAGLAIERSLGTPGFDAFLASKVTFFCVCMHSALFHGFVAGMAMAIAAGSLAHAIAIVASIARSDGEIASASFFANGGIHAATVYPDPRAYVLLAIAFSMFLLGFGGSRLPGPVGGRVAFWAHGVFHLVMPFIMAQLWSRRP